MRAWQLSIASLFLSLIATQAASQTNALPLARPINAIEGVLDAFKTHNIVGLDEGSHGNVQGHQFRLALIRDPRFVDAVNDIVVECGNALYQNVIDKFVSGGDVAHADLRKVWENTTQTNTVWDIPIYEEFFRAVRELNGRLPENKKLRILLGDPPIDWDKAPSADEVDAFSSRRDTHAVEVIKREVLAKGHRALVVYGSGHFMRKNLYWQLPNQQEAEYMFRLPVLSIASLLDADPTAKLFTIWALLNVRDPSILQADLAQWPAPSVALVRNTQLGEKSYMLLAPQVRSFRMIDGKLKGFDPDPARSPRIDEQFDAVLYIGPYERITYSEITPALCDDEQYMKMRIERIGMRKWSGDTTPADRLKKVCADKKIK